MGQHRALRASGGAGGIENGDEVVPADFAIGEDAVLAVRRLHERAVTADAKRHHVGAVALGKLGNCRHALRPDNDDFRFGVAKEIVELGQRIGGVERQKHRAGPRAGEIKRDGLRAFLHLHGNAVALRDAGIGKRLRDPARQRPELRIAEVAPVGVADKDLFRRPHTRR